MGCHATEMEIPPLSSLCPMAQKAKKGQTRDQGGPIEQGFQYMKSLIFKLFKLLKKQRTPAEDAYRPPHWHDPEEIDPEQETRDILLGRNKFYVYILTTSRGHYVGHTANLKTRIRAHRLGSVPSTTGTYPKLLWVSLPLKSRAKAAKFEAALKALRDQESPRFQKITNLAPRPWRKEQP